METERRGYCLVSHHAQVPRDDGDECTSSSAASLFFCVAALTRRISRSFDAYDQISWKLKNGVVNLPLLRLCSDGLSRLKSEPMQNGGDGSEGYGAPF